MNRLTLSGDYLGQRLKLRPWQEEIVRRLFGTVDANGVRQYTEAFLFIPRKNAKTMLAAAIAVYCLLDPKRRGQEIYSVAGDQEQAAKIFEYACAMIEHNPDFDACCTILHSKKTILVPHLKNKYKALSSDSKRKLGLSPSVVLFDELLTQSDRKLWSAMRTAMGARKDRLFIPITTAGNDKTSLCYEQFERAQRAKADPEKYPHILPVLYYAEDSDDWRDEATWHKASPALGDFNEISVMREALKDALEIPSAELEFRQYYLNQWVSSETNFISRDRWDLCKGNVDPQSLLGRKCYAGLDVSSTTDLTAFVLLFPRDDGTFQMLSHLWLPAKNVAAAEKRDKVTYQAWGRAGHVTLNAGETFEFDMVLPTIVAASKQYKIVKLLADDWSDDALQRIRKEGIRVEKIAQIAKYMSPPTKRLQKMVIDGTLVHNGNPVFSWMIDNARVELDSNENIKLTKKRSTGRIDGLVALVEAIAGQMADANRAGGIREAITF